MWKWISNKIKPYVAEEADALGVVVNHVMEAMEHHEDLITSNLNLQEEVFRLRDEVEELKNQITMEAAVK
jgi:hypothetical protein